MNNLKKSDNEKYNLLEILNVILKSKSYSDIAASLNISVGTIKRWEELKNISSAYYFELLKLAEISIDYSIFN